MIDVAFVIRAPLHRYPPSIFQAELLLEAGLRVAILDVEDGGYRACNIPGGAERIVLAQADDPWGGASGRRRWLRPFQRKWFHGRLASALQRINPRVIIAYEPAAMYNVGRIYRWKRPLAQRIIWHFHEFPELLDGQGYGSRFDILQARKNSSYPAVTIFPDAERARCYEGQTGCHSEIQIVMNCPRRLDQIPPPRLRAHLQSLGVTIQGSIVFYNGVVGPNHGLMTAVRSMGYWPDASHLVLVGPVNSVFRELLMASADARVRDRVHFVGPVSPDDIWSFRASADVYLTLFEHHITNMALSAGASNKRFEAMAVAVPQVADDGEGLGDVVEKNNAGFCVDPEDHQALGRAVSGLLTNPEKRAIMGRAAREAHLRQFNYEEQFAAVRESIVAFCRGANGCTSPLVSQRREQTVKALDLFETSATTFATRIDRHIADHRYYRGQVFLKELTSLCPAGSDVLDYGCGPGRLAWMMAKAGYSVTGIDPALAMIQEANGLPRAGLQLRFEQLRDPTLLDGQYSAVVCSSVIEYVPKPAEMLRQLFQLLRPGGVLLITFANRRSLLYLYTKLRACIPLPHQRWQYNVWSSQEAVRALAGCGFQSIRLVRYLEAEPLDQRPLLHPLTRYALFGTVGLITARRPSQHPEPGSQTSIS